VDFAAGQVQFGLGQVGAGVGNLRVEAFDLGVQGVDLLALALQVGLGLVHLERAMWLSAERVVTRSSET
jgi:hypothetical protein